MFKAMGRSNIPQKRKAEIPSRNSFPDGPTRAKPTVRLGQPKEEKEQGAPSSLRNQVRRPPRLHKLSNCKCGVLMFEAVQRALCTAEKQGEDSTTKPLSERSNESKADNWTGRGERREGTSKSPQPSKPGIVATWAPQAKQLCLWGSYV